MTPALAIFVISVVAFVATLAQQPHCVEPETQDAAASMYMRAGQEERAWIAVGGTDHLCDEP